MKIPYSKPNIPQLQDTDLIIIKKIINSGIVSNSEWVEKLENTIANRFEIKYVLACSNATNALIIAMKSCGIRNKKVALPSFTWPSTFYAIDCNFCKPIFTDIDPKTWCMTNIPDNADAILAVDTFGIECPKFDKDIPVIYDAAHGWDLPNLGKRGIVEVVSLSYTKNVTATEGGLLLTNDESVYRSAKELRRLTCRMEEINAYLALCSILNYNYENRKRIVDKYIKNFKFNYTTQDLTKNHNLSVFSILLPKSSIRNSILSALSSNGFETKVYYDPLSKGLPITDDIFSRIISLPCYAEIEEHQDTLIRIINSSAIDTPGHSYINEYITKSI